MTSTVVYDLVPAKDIQEAHALEILSFPDDEAASLLAFQFRQSQAPDLFLGAYLPNEDGSRTLVGYVCSTLSPLPSLTHESMSTHTPNSSSVCIHSICVPEERRRQGIALDLLKEYVSRLENASKEGASYERILLITHEDMMELYSKAGFEMVGKSAVVHGSQPWFEMRKILPPSSPTEEPRFPPGLWEALQASSSSRKRPVARLLSGFPNGVGDVTTPESSNKHDLLCPREGCGSVILKNEVALLVNRESIQLEPSGRESPHLSPLPSPPALVNWWKVTPNAMAFENIGFSRPVGSQLSTGDARPLKLLLCAECDLGPLGWCEEGGSEFWLAVGRVGYKG